MARALIWFEGEAKGWGCSSCRWRFPVPTMLGADEAKAAYDRLAAVKFREHQCEMGTPFSASSEQTTPDTARAFSDRARTLIKRGYTPKVAVDLVLHEMEIEHGNDSRMMEKARADAQDFLMKARKGLI